MQTFAGIIRAIPILLICWLVTPAATWADTTMPAGDSLAGQNELNVESDSSQTQSMAQDSTENKKKETHSKVSDIKSFWELTKLGGSIRWWIFLVLALGMILIVEKTIVIIVEERRSKALLHKKFTSVSVENITNSLKKSPKNLLSELFTTLVDIFQATGRAADFHEEIANYIKFQQDRFNSFKARLAFLSDTAGALGLLGTVWGMFQTFFGGNLEKQLILNGMGIALITTLMGLVVSIILNFFGTEIFSKFNKQLDRLQTKADEFRIRFLEIEQENQRQLEAERSMLGTLTGREGRIHPSKKPAIPPPQKKLGPPHKLIYISGDGQSGTVNKQLPNPFIVELLDTYNNRLPNHVVRFEVDSREGFLSNGGKTQELSTDLQGRASTFLTLGTHACKNIVKSSARGLNGHTIEYGAIATADAPSSLTLLSGNNQNSPAGSLLPDPLVVGVRDTHGNPIPNFQVNFKISLGNGTFSGGKSKLSVITDNNGEAQAFVVLGKKPGFNRVMVTAKKLRRAKLEFQVLGQ